MFLAWFSNLLVFSFFSNIALEIFSFFHSLSPPLNKTYPLSPQAISFGHLPWRTLWWSLSQEYHMLCLSAWPGPQRSQWATPSSPQWGKQPGWPCRRRWWWEWKTTTLHPRCVQIETYTAGKEESGEENDHARRVWRIGEWQSNERKDNIDKKGRKTLGKREWGKQEEKRREIFYQL